jgi:hypothetical protein
MLQRWFEVMFNVSCVVPCHHIMLHAQVLTCRKDSPLIVTTNWTCKSKRMSTSDEFKWKDIYGMRTTF